MGDIRRQCRSQEFVSGGTPLKKNHENAVLWCFYEEIFAFRGGGHVPRVPLPYGTAQRDFDL